MTPRSTRLIRAETLPAAHRAIASLARVADPLLARLVAVLVPTRAAGHQLRRTLESLRFSEPGPGGDRVLVLPELLTREDWYARLGDRAGLAAPRLSVLEREVMLGAASRDAIEAGAIPPFRLRPGLIAEMLAFYDRLYRQQRTVDAFERVVVEDLEARADTDRGAERLLRQTRFLVAAYRAFERRVAESGRLDEHRLRALLLEPTGGAAFRRVVVTVGDRVADPSGGLYPADFDLLVRLPHLEAIDIVATRAQLAAGLHERLHALVPDLEEVDAEPSGPAPRIVAPEGDVARLYTTSRDREEELRAIARRIKRAAREAGPAASTERTAVVFRRPLPYVYLGATVFESAGIEYESADALPLAAEPFAAVFDLIAAAVESRLSRTSLVALLRSPHLALEADGVVPDADEVSAFDRGLGDRNYLGDGAALARMARSWSGPGALAARSAAAVAGELSPLAGLAPVSAHVAALLGFLRAHERLDGDDEVVRARHLRARGAVLGALEELRAAAGAHDDPPSRFADVAATIRRWIESQTFSPRRGRGGVQFADATAGRYGDFDTVHLAGLVEGDWPESGSRNIFYPAFLLADLGWPADAARLAAERATLADLLRLARHRVAVSTFTLEDDAIVNPSPLVDELERAGLEVVRVAAPDRAIFADEAFATAGARRETVPGGAPAAGGDAAGWLALRLARSAASLPAFHGHAGPAPPRAYSVTAIERFLECPFKYFADKVLELPEEVTDSPTMDPRARGQFVHEVFHAFYAEWQAGGRGAIGTGDLADARALFAGVAERRLATLPAGEAAVERMRLLGSAAAPGLGELALAAEAEHPAPVVERLLEFRLDGEFEFTDGAAVRTVRLRGKADRIDLLADGRFRLIDYKTGHAPVAARSIQLPVYAACASQQLARTRGGSWELAEAGYLAFGDARPLRVDIKDDAKRDAALADGVARLLDAIDRIERGEMPPRPATRWLCRSCAYATVCRKDYVDEE